MIRKHRLSASPTPQKGTEITQSHSMLSWNTAWNCRNAITRRDHRSGFRHREHRTHTSDSDAKKPSEIERPFDIDSLESLLSLDEAIPPRPEC
ncbi:hypothetical protein [Kitasatospora sp. NPDC056531]|uniref:hypothetical protein n=1 Tax=Kitasatospora sp. NPDC056531 TaxID=3345856 RepID=UPI0036CAAFC4